MGKVHEPAQGQLIDLEAQEDTGLPDLVPWSGAQTRRVVIVGVPVSHGEPGYQHAHVRYVMAVQIPDAIRPDSANAPLRWLTLPRGARPPQSPTSGKPWPAYGGWGLDGGPLNRQSERR